MFLDAIINRKRFSPIPRPPLPSHIIPPPLNLHLISFLLVTLPSTIISIILSLSLSFPIRFTRYMNDEGEEEITVSTARLAVPFHRDMVVVCRWNREDRCRAANVSPELASTRFAVLYLAYRNVTGVSAVYQSRARQPVIVDNEILIQCARSRRSCTRTNTPSSRPLSFRGRTGWKL